MTNSTELDLLHAIASAGDDDLPVILECYMHKLAEEERMEQVARLLW